MCGIAGILRAEQRPDDRQIVERMLGKMERRGPDASGIWQEGPITLGHRRLSIIDLDSRADQPMSTRSGRLTVSFNGEIYNFEELREQMGLDPGDLRTTSDTEILLEAWDRWADESNEKLVGQWAFAIFDKHSETLWLSRDRFGEKPLYYCRTAEGLAFASSIEALIEVPFVPRELDPESLEQYLTYRYTIAPRTVVKGVSKVVPGTFLRVQGSDLTERRWFAPTFNSSGQKKKPREELAEEFDALFTQACRRCLVGDVPSSLLLSDGIDSNAVRAALTRGGESVPSYTYVPDGGEDSAHGVPEGSIRVEADVGDRLQAMVPVFSSLTEPTGDGAALATWMLIRGARDHSTVFLCGHGADELLGGYRLSQSQFRLRMIRELAWLPDSVIGKLITRYTNGAEEIAVRRSRLQQFDRSRTSEAARYVINRPLRLSEVQRFWTHDGSAPRPDPSHYLNAIDDLYASQETTATDLDRVLGVMSRTFLAENILKFADSVAMDSSAELRMPFLDRDLVEFLFKMPDYARISRWPGRRNTKLILRWWGKGRIDEDALTAPKRTFPFGRLMPLMETHGETVRSWARDVPALRRCLPGIQDWMSRDLEFYHGERQGTLWAVLALGIWAQHLGLE